MNDSERQPVRRWTRTTVGIVAGWVLVVALLACYVAFQVSPLLDDRGSGIVGLGSHQNDYKHVYLGSILLNRGLSPYSPDNMLMMAWDYSVREDPRFRTILPYVYLPFTGMVMTPLSMLPFATSVVAFQAINHVAILGGLLLAAFAVGWRGDPWTVALVLALAAFNAVVMRQNNAGQLNAVLVLGYGVLLLGLVRGWHPAAIGFIAAFLMLFKLSPGILLFWFLFRREWRRAAWMAGAAIALTLVAVGIYGMDRHVEFLSVLSDMGYGRSTWARFGHTFWRDPYNQSLNALFHRLLVDFPQSGITPWFSLPASRANALTGLVSLGILAAMYVYTERSRANAAAIPFSLGLAVCVSLLLPSIMWDHYLVQLLLPLVVLLAAPVPGESRGLIRLLAALAAVIMCLPVPLDAEALRSGPAIVLMNLKLLPVLLCFRCCLIVMKRPPAAHHPD